MKRKPLIAVSSCLKHHDSSPYKQPIFNGRPLLYWEESLAFFLMQYQCLPYLIPRPQKFASWEELLAPFDGLLLQGGVDVAPETYGETALKQDWAGDANRDEYELQIIDYFYKRNKPILGICRGVQILNVYFGGTLYQDITAQKPDAIFHRDGISYEKNGHALLIQPDSYFSSLYPNLTQSCVNSVHHQAIKQLAPDLMVQATSKDDGIIEAVLHKKAKFCVGVQWHPEFVSPFETLDPQPMMQAFKQACLV